MQRYSAMLLLLFPSIGGAATVIPIEIEGGTPVVVARVNGVALQLVVDSGGGLLSLKSGAIKRVSAIPTESTRSVTDALGNKSMVAMFKINALELGNKTFRWIDADELGSYAKNSPGDGIIGRKFLNQFIAVYDYASRKVTLYSSHERKAAERACRGVQINTVPDDDEIIVSIASTDHQPMRMLWDTGATYSFVKKSFADEHALPVRGEFYTTERFGLGGHDFGQLELVALDIKAPVNVDGYVGGNFFSDHVVCIDPSMNRIRVRKN